MDPQDALEQLQQPTELYILNISQPILDPTSSEKRSSNASDQERTPSALRADLEHYRELFSKLRFSYVEQVTKERFLRAVTAEQPEFVDVGENQELVSIQGSCSRVVEHRVRVGASILYLDTRRH